MHAFITSHFGAWTTVMACSVPSVQRVCSPKTTARSLQNRAARYILNTPPRSPSLPLLHQLHWLPIESRICHKLCSLMYRVNHSIAPSYLSELCVPFSYSSSIDHSGKPRFLEHLANRSLLQHHLLDTFCQTLFVTPKVIAIFIRT